MGLMGLTGPTDLGSPAQASLAWVFGSHHGPVYEGPKNLISRAQSGASRLLPRPDLSSSQNPAHDGENNADENAGSEGKVESEIALLDRNISWQVSEPAKTCWKFPK